LFGLFGEQDDTPPYAEAAPWSVKQRLKGEKDTLGFYLSGHPAEPYHHELSEHITPIADLGKNHLKKARVCALVRSLRRIITKRGKQLVIMTLEDGSGMLDAVVFSEVFEAATTPPASGDIICLEGEIGEDNFTGGVRVTATAVYSVAEARARFSKNLALNLTPDNANQFEKLKALLEQYPGRCPVRLKYVNGDAEKIVALPSRWGVLPEDNLLEALMQLFDTESVSLCY